MDHVVDQKAYRGLTYVLYIFYLISSFTGGLLAIIALMLNYIKRKEVKGTLLDSHLLGKSVPFGGAACGIY
ncbi:hypothetical protein ACFSHO_01300 [Acinetobacter vivianii]